MPKRRQIMVKEAFERLVASCGGTVTLDDIRRVGFDVFNGPAYPTARELPLS